MYTGDYTAQPDWPGWVPARRSRSPHANVATKVADLEKRFQDLEQSVKELLSEKTWWTWWYQAWGKWLQNTVLRFSDTIVTFTNAWLAQLAPRADPGPGPDHAM